MGKTVSTLDVSIQTQIVKLLQELKTSMEGFTYLFIAHDPSVFRYISSIMAVVRLGHIDEIMDRKSLIKRQFNLMHRF